MDPDDGHNAVFLNHKEVGNNAKYSYRKESSLNISHYQRDANQNNNEVPLHTSQNGSYPKVYKQ